MNNCRIEHKCYPAHEWFIYYIEFKFKNNYISNTAHIFIHKKIYYTYIEVTLIEIII